MKIIEVNIPADGTDSLQDISMKKLGDIVLIAGKNSSGKSRLLNKISRHVRNKPADDLVLLHKQRIEQAVHNIENLKQLNEQIRGQNIDEAKDHIKQNEADIENYKKQIQEYESIANWNIIRFTITDQTRDRAIGEIRDLAASEIKRLKARDSASYKDGQLHGFWVQQLANAALILR